MTSVDAELGGHGVGCTQTDQSIVRTEITIQALKNTRVLLKVLPKSSNELANFLAKTRNPAQEILFAAAVAYVPSV